MNKVHFITNGSNAKKAMAIKNALAKLPVAGFTFNTLIFENEENKPLSAYATLEALHDRLISLLNKNKDENDQTTVYAIDIQKGVNLLDEDEELALIYSVGIFAQDDSKLTVATETISLPEEIRTLVKSGKDLYDAYEIVFGADVKSKKVSIYEKQTGKSEESLLEDLVFKALLF